MKIRNLFYALLALPLFFVACGEDNAVDQVKNPTVKVTAGTAAETSLSFTVASTDATKVAYLVVEGSDVPTASEVLTSGTAVDANKSVTVTKDGLKTSTEYVIAVAAQNSVATVKDFTQMTTLSTITPGPEPGEGNEDEGTFTGTHLYTEYYADGGLHYYYFEIANKSWNENNGMVLPGGSCYCFEVISNTKGNGALPNGTYTLAETYSSGTLNPDYTYLYRIGENGDMVAGFEMFSEAIVTITDGKIEANVVMRNDGSVRKVVYEGSLAVGDGGTQLPTEFEATHTADKWYWGGSSSYGNKYAVSGEGFSVDVHFPSDKATETTLATGLYTWTITTMFGYNDFVEFTTLSFIVNGTSVPVDGGTALVEAEGDVYHIEMTLEGRDGNVYMIEYNGKLNDKGEVGGGDEPSVVVFTNFEYNTYNSSYYFHEYKLTNDAGDKMNLRVNDRQANEGTIYPGTYNWITASWCGNEGYFSTDSVYVGGVKYDVSGGTLVVAEKETLDLTITLTLANGEEAVFTYAEAEGNEDEPSTPAEPVKLATPSVFGLVSGNAATISWQEIVGAKDYTVTLNDTDVQTVTTASITFTGLEYETTYSVSVVANSSDEALYITSDAGTATFTTEAEGTTGGDEGGEGNEGEVGDAIMFSTCTYLENVYGMLKHYKFASNDGQNIVHVFMNSNNSGTATHYIPVGNYTNDSMNNTANNSSSFNLDCNVGQSITDTKINGEVFANGISTDASNTMSVTEANDGGNHEIVFNIKGNVYRFSGTIK